MLSSNDLANMLIQTFPVHINSQGGPLSSPNQTTAYAAGIVAALQAGTVSNPPNTIVGTTVSGAPLVAGAGTGGVMVVTPGPMLAQTLPAFATSPGISKENVGIISYISTGLVVFQPGSIVGNCTNTPTSPGPLVAGAGTGGMITGLSGAAAAAAVGATGPMAIGFYTALCNYIMANASVSYATGTITGTCPPGGGPLANGTGAGGTIA
jgi:hypothetical protein